MDTISISHDGSINYTIHKNRNNDKGGIDILISKHLNFKPIKITEKPLTCAAYIKEIKFSISSNKNVCIEDGITAFSVEISVGTIHSGDVKLIKSAVHDSLEH